MMIILVFILLEYQNFNTNILIFTPILISFQKKQNLITKFFIEKKWEFYSGKDETPFPLKILKQDLPIYLESDVELIESKNKFEYYKTILTFLEGILKSLNNRGFQINNAIRWKQNTEGWD